MNLRQVLVLIATAVLAVSFTGCDKSGAKQVSSDEQTPVLLWYVPGKKQDATAMVVEEVNKIAQQKIGAKIDLQWMDNGAYQERMTMMIASNSNYDLCFTSSWTNRFLPNVTKGAYLDITDMLDTVAPALKQSLPHYIFSAATYKNRIYAVPNLQVVFTQNALSAYKQYADKYDFDPSRVKRAEDIEPLLKAMKENEPELIPFRPNFGSKIFIENYEILSNAVAIKKDTTDYKLELIYNTDEYRHGLDVLSDWYKKGYIRQDINSVLDESAEQNMGRFGIWACTYKPGLEAEAFQTHKQEVLMMRLNQPYLTASAGSSAMTAISKNTKHPEKSLKLIELTNTDKEVYNLLCFGIEGTHHTKDDEGKIVVDTESGYFPNTAWKFGNQFNATLMPNQEDGIWELTENMNSNSKRSPIAGFVIDTEPIKTEISQLSTVEKQYSSLDNGSSVSEELLAEYIEKRNASGQQRVLEEIQRQLDEWIKLKN